MNVKHYGLLGSAAMAAVCLSSAAPAQSGDAAEQASPADDIVVTARRVEERLTDVPVAITVVSGAQLERQNAQSLSEMQRNVPSLTITPSSGRGTGVNIQIRGQRQSELSVAGDPSVAVYINEVAVARPAALDTTAFDLESVQVLKGPQGTLFGRNSTGGAILLTTRKPGDTFGGYVRGYIEDPIATGVEGAIDLPVAQGVALRVAGNYQWRRGYTKVLNTGQRLDDRDRWSTRATLDLQPSDTVRSTFVGEMFRSNENGIGIFAFNYTPGYNPSAATSRTLVNLGYPAAYAAAQAQGFHETMSNIRHSSKVRSYALSNVTTIDLSDAIVLKNVAGWRKYSAQDNADQDGTSVPVSATTPALTGARQYSDELQLQGKSFEGKLDWILGGFYFNETGYDTVSSYTLRVPYVSEYSVNDFSAENTSHSLFGHASYTLPFASRTRIYGGARRTWDKREIVFRNGRVTAAGVFTCSVAGATNADCRLERTAKFHKLTWEVGADFQPAPDSLVYATVSTGYRSGGFNGRATSAGTQVAFRPENVTNYEVGVKSSFALGTGRLSFSAAAYQSKYKDIQRNIIRNIAPPGELPLTVTTTVNAASATIKGFEFEMTARASDRFSATGRIGYVRPRYDSFRLFNPRLGQEVDASGNRFYGVAPIQFGAGFNWIVSDTEAGTVSLASDLSFSDKFELNDLNVPGGRADSSTVVNASLAWEKLLGSRVTGTLYVKNLTDEKYILGGLQLNSSLDIGSVYHSAPRVIGVAMRIPFGD